MGVETVALAVLRSVGTTEVNLYEVEVELLEEEVTILLVVAIEADVVGYGVASVIVAAGVGSGV